MKISKKSIVEMRSKIFPELREAFPRKIIAPFVRIDFVHPQYGLMSALYDVAKDDFVSIMIRSRNIEL